MGKVKIFPIFSSIKTIGVANGDTMTKNNNQSLKMKDGHEVPKKREYWLGCNFQGKKYLRRKIH